MSPDIRSVIRYARSKGYFIFRRDGTDEYIVKFSWHSPSRYVTGEAALYEVLPHPEKQEGIVNHQVKLQEEFIRDWLTEHVETSVVDTEFHAAFLARFGGKFKPTLWGAQPVSKAMLRLAEMHRRGELQRTRIGLSEHAQGFPNWVYSYSLPGRAKG